MFILTNIHRIVDEITDILAKIAALVVRTLTHRILTVRALPHKAYGFQTIYSGMVFEFVLLSLCPLVARPV